MSYGYNRPAFVHADAVLVLNLPMKVPTPINESVGSRAISAIGLPATHEVRRDYLLSMPLRFWDWEWPSVQAFIEAAQRSLTAFVLRIDQDIEDEYVCYLQTPAMGERFTPALTNFPRVLEMTITVRSVTDPFDVRYYDPVTP